MNDREGKAKRQGYNPCCQSVQLFVYSSACCLFSFRTRLVFSTPKNAINSFQIVAANLFLKITAFAGDGKRCWLEAERDRFHLGNSAA